jgi:thiol-disulfide isomerase/thioredoxin
MKLYQKIIIAVIVSLISILGGIFTWIYQFIIVGVVFFVSTFFLIDNKIKKWITILFLLSPFLLIYGGITFPDVIFRHFQLTHIYPIIIISIISTFLGLVFKLLYQKYSKKIIIVFASIYILVLIVGGYIFMCNWLYYVFTEESDVQIEKISDIKLWDFSDNEIKLDEIDNKVIVLDFWTLSCGACFRKFPDFEKIKNSFSDKEVVFYAVYIPWNRDYTENSGLEDRLKWIEEQGFTFNVVKTDSITANKLGISTVPHLFIFDKAKKLTYNNGFIGLIGQEKKIIINNLYSVIDKLIEE